MPSAAKLADGESKPRSRTNWLCVLFLATTGALFWALDGWLFLRLRAIADETLSNGPNPILVIDGREELQTYSPKRLARFATFPSSKIRTVVCLSLENRRDDVDPSAWKGVIPKLIQLYSDDADETVRECARWTLANLPCIPEEDVDFVLSFVEKSAPNDEALRHLNATFLSKIGAKFPETWPRIAPICVRRIESDEPTRRSQAFQLMRSLNAKAPETLKVFQEMMAAGDPDNIASHAGRTMLACHPQLVDEYIKGNAAERKLILTVASEDARHAMETESALKRKQAAPNYPKPILSKEQLDRAEQMAIRSLRPDVPLEIVQKACSLIYFQPNGASLLLDGARKLRGKARASAIGYLHSALYSTPAAAEKLLDEVISWAHEDDPDVQEAAINFFNGLGSPKWLSAQRKDPKSSVVETCRWMLDHHPGRADRGCLEIIFQASATLTHEDADRVAKAVLRYYAEQEKTHAQNGYAKSGTKLFDRYQDDLQRCLMKEQYDRPSVRRLFDERKRLEQKNVFEPFSKAPPSKPTAR